MLKNYFKIAYRNLLRNKLYSAINILGLTIGITACLLIMIYVLDELSYDKFHSKGERIYRVAWEQQRQNELSKSVMIPFPIKTSLENNLPGVEAVSRLRTNTSIGGPINLKHKDKSFNETRVFYSDPDIFKIFDFPFLIGDPQTALQNANSIILTESSAKKYFGNADPMGKNLLFDGFQNLTVTGIVKDVPENSHILFDFLVPLENFRKTRKRRYNADIEDDWSWHACWTYLLIKEGVDISKMKNKMPELIEKQFPLENPYDYQITFQPLDFIYLHSDLEGELDQKGNADQLYLFSLIAFIILLIALINFMNLATARSIKRAKEVGLRKVMGAVRRTLIYQFLGEALLISFIALFHAFIMLSLVLEIFNSFTGKAYAFKNVINDPIIIGGSILITIIAGILAGSYPSFYLSSFKPAKTLKNDFKSSKTLPVRKVLVIIQFSISLVFIFSILLIRNQVRFLADKDLGYTKDLVLTLEGRRSINRRLDVFRNNLHKDNNVKGVYRGMIPGVSVWENSVIPDGVDDYVSSKMLFAGYNLTDLFELNVIDGRSFNRNFDLDSLDDYSALIVNEAAIKNFGWEGDVIGKEVKWIGGVGNKTPIKGNVVGVVEDFHYESLYTEIKPLIIRLCNWGNIAIRIDGKNVDKTLKHIEKEYQSMVPGWDFEYSFLDDDLYRNYQKEERLSDLIQYFALLAIFISCTGLFGLVAFMSERRKKEIAIRKTLGATLENIAFLLSRDFMKLVFVASIIGCPIAYYAMTSWLSNFAYRVSIDPLLFIISIASSLMIALISMSYQSIKVASDNPVNALRNE